MSHDMHRNSLESFRALNTAARRKAILEAFRNNPVPMTDRECCHVLGFEEMNAVRPRLTEMVQDGTLVEVGSIHDPLTKRSVRMTTVKDRQMTIGEAL